MFFWTSLCFFPAKAEASRLAQVLRNGPRHSVRHTPGRLQVEATRDRIHVQDFTGEVEAWMLLAFQRLGMDFRKGNAAAGHKFLLVRIAARNGEGLVAQLRGQALQGFGMEVLCPCVGLYATAFEQRGPESGRQVRRHDITQ